MVNYVIHYVCIMCVTCSFRESVSQVDAGQSVSNGDVDNNNHDAVEFKPKTEPDSPSSHHQCQPAQQCGAPPVNGASSQSSSASSGLRCDAVEPPHRVTSSHLLANHQPALPHHYQQHQQMSSPHHLHHHQQQHGYGMSAMGLESLDAAVGLAAAAAAQCAGRSFTQTSPFSFTPAHHRIGASYYDAVRQAGFDNM